VYELVYCVVICISYTLSSSVEFDVKDTDKKVAFISCLSNNLSSLSMPTVAPNMPRETLVPFCALPS
jgi:hypothetical protein